MRLEPDVPLAPFTTLRVGGPARELVTATTDDEVVDAVRSADRDGIPCLVIGGGSNLLVGDAGFAGRAVRVTTGGISREGDLWTVAAGQTWDDVVAEAVGTGCRGIETLSGVPGSAGATPIQNVGAYGSDVSRTVVSVRWYDRRTGALGTSANAECGFTYRHSVFKADPEHRVILSVTFRLPESKLSDPIRYAELAKALGVEVGGAAPLGDVRDAVLALRRGKGMVLDPADHDTWSAGSFFTNPILPADAPLPEGAPRYPEPDGRVKTSAAWLIDRAGFTKGYGTGPARLSEKHTLALTNRGEATAADLLKLARDVRAGVLAAFGIELVPEPVLVGISL